MKIVLVSAFDVKESKTEYLRECRKGTILTSPDQYARLFFTVMVELLCPPITGSLMATNGHVVPFAPSKVAIALSVDETEGWFVEDSLDDHLNIPSRYKIDPQAHQVGSTQMSATLSIPARPLVEFSHCHQLFHLYESSASGI